MKKLLERILKFISSPKITSQLYSFAKTYVTVFLALYLQATLRTGDELTIFNMAVIAPSARWAFISVLRNIYKLVTEK